MTDEEQKLYYNALAFSGELKKLIVLQMVKKGLSPFAFHQTCGFAELIHMTDWLRGTVWHNAAQKNLAREKALELLGIIVEVTGDRVKITCNE